MKCKTIAAAAVAATTLAGCSAGNTKANETSVAQDEITLTPDTIGLAAVIGEESPAGRVEVYDLGDFRLHVYYTQDVMNDASYIIEGADSVVTMEEPLFKVNVKEFDSYLVATGKPAARRITDYHLGGTGDHEITMPEGMPEFIKGPAYGGMMNSFALTFGDSMTTLPTGKENEVRFGSTEVYAGIPFEFRHGATSDFPAASILIGGKAYYTHWAPAKTHMSHLQLTSRDAVDAEHAEALSELNSGAVLFIGGHGGAALKDAVEFRIGYLDTVKQLLEVSKTAREFADALRNAYPGLPGEEGVDALAATLYK